MKTICLDLRALQIGHQNRGIGMHIRSILENLSESDDRYLFYCFDESDPIEKLGIKTKVNYKIVQSPTIDTSINSFDSLLNIPRLIFHRFGPLRKLKPDVFVQFDFMLGLPRWRGIRKVMIGYDLIPLIMRNDYLPGVRHAWNHTSGKKQKIKAIMRSLYYQFRHWLHYRTYKRADKIVCISEASSESFHKLLGIQKSRLAVSHLAPVSFDVTPDDTVAKKIGKPYIFYIGGTDVRKSLKDIVHSYNIARGRGEDIALVLAGNEFREVDNVPDIKGRNAILYSPYRNDIHLVGFVNDSEKVGLYTHARAFAFASTFEGFGLPVVEAMAASCPVISYNNSSIPEVAGDAVRLVKTGDIVDLACGIIELSDQKLREQRITDGVNQAKKFNWNRHVDTLVSFL